MSQHEAQRRYFDAQADSYDQYTADGAWTPNQYLASVLHELKADRVEVGTALDLGAGTGQTLEVVRAAFPEAGLWASDLSPAMLERAAVRVPEAHFEVTDIASHVASLTRTFDLITAIGCLELVDDLMTLLPQLIGRVTPGGHLAITSEPLIDGLGAEHRRSATRTASDPAWHDTWSTAGLLQALPGGRLRASHLFTAYQRAGKPVLYELLLVQHDPRFP